MSPGYLEQVAFVDGLVGRLLDAMRTDDTVLLQSDHGGHDRSHGTEMVEDMTVPWMIAGPNIVKQQELRSSVSLLETAPTLARVLEVPVSPHWEGACVVEAFAAS